jgi:threonine aldolase
MTTLNRRRFLELGTIAGGLGVVAPGFSFGAPGPARGDAAAADPDDRVIRLSGDGLGLTPAQYSRLLTHLVEEKGIVPDSYILEGVVEELEKQFARILGKERAVFMPTGTLANHLAVRALAGGPSRAIVQSESHLYQDTGDCVQFAGHLEHEVRRVSAKASALIAVSRE